MSGEPDDAYRALAAANGACVMGVSFLPSTELGLLSWSANFAAIVAEDPEFWGVSVEQSDAFVALQSAFAEAIRVACTPATRTSGNVIVKNEADAALRASARSLARLIDAQPDVTDADRTALGLTVRAARTNAAAPTARPFVSARLRDGRTVSLSILDRDRPGRRLPVGIAGAIVFRAVGEVPPATRDGWQFVTLTGRTAIDVFCDESIAPGAQVWFTAAWFNHRKELGPFADAAYIHLAGGPVLSLGRINRRAA